MDAIIKVEKLSKEYHGQAAVVDLDISIKKGEVFGLLGENGAGKTTSVECILGTTIANKGKVRILGMDPIKERRKLFEQVGVQFQESNYQDKITVKELCEETQSFYRSAADYQTLLKKFGIGDKGKSLVSELSGGQKQRLFLVLALIPNPKVVFLDELTTGLDVKARREVWKHLLDLKKKGLTIFLTSHFMDEVAILCDKIGILKEGKIIFRGTVEEAIDKSPYDKLEEAYLWYTDEEEINNESI